MNTKITEELKAKAVIAAHSQGRTLTPEDVIKFIDGPIAAVQPELEAALRRAEAEVDAAKIIAMPPAVELQQEINLQPSELIAALEQGQILRWQRDPAQQHTGLCLYHSHHEDGERIYTTYGWESNFVDGRSALLDIMYHPEHWQVTHHERKAKS